MSLRIYNSMTKQKEEFKSITPGEVKMYVCGPTVYDFLHTGNFRGPIFFNLVRNWFEKLNYKVTYVLNYTDVDDKIINRAKKEGVDSLTISEKYIKEYQQDYGSLKLKPHSCNPKVTDYIPNIVQFIVDLVEKNKAYVVDGDVYYSVKDFSTYGKLSHKNLEDLEAGYRIDVDPRKKHSSDFALWKKAKEGEPSWPSPWGEGRPGWHIECSVMIHEVLGDSIDIHGGGMDLIFPHHENEIAQSEGHSGKTFVKYWMHNNMLNFGAQKMSKSLGNIKTARSFIEDYNAEIFKFMILSAHYRSILDFSEEQIEKAIVSLARVYSSLSWAEEVIKHNLPLAPIPAEFQKALDHASHGIEDALNDDFNTPELMARIFEVVRLFNNLARKPGPITADKKAMSEVLFHWIRDKGQLMSLFQEPPSVFLRTIDDMLLEKKNILRANIDAIVEQRTLARNSKDYKKSDELRDQLIGLGIAVQDSKEATHWEVDKSKL